MAEIEELVGRVLIRVDGLREGSDRVEFFCLDGARYVMSHSQSCCESVDLHEIHGDVTDVHGYVTEAYEASSEGRTAVHDYTEDYEWTFYTISTRHGAVTLRWYGTSNGYYSTSVDFERVS